MERLMSQSFLWCLLGADDSVFNPDWKDNCQKITIQRQVVIGTSPQEVLEHNENDLLFRIAAGVGDVNAFRKTMSLTNFASLVVPNFE